MYCINSVDTGALARRSTECGDRPNSTAARCLSSNIPTKCTSYISRPGCSDETRLKFTWQRYVIRSRAVGATELVDTQPRTAARSCAGAKSQGAAHPSSATNGNVAETQDSNCCRLNTVHQGLDALRPSGSLRQCPVCRAR